MKFMHEDINIELKGFLSDDMTDKEFFNFCIQNDGQRVERDENKQIFIMAPTASNTGAYNIDISTELNLWNRKNKSGKSFDSSTGFTLPDRSVRSPDASWIKLDRWNSLPEREKEKFAKICPDFVIELKSKSDSLKYLKAKMIKWIENGCRLAWLIDLQKKQTTVYRENGSIEIVEGFDKKLSGEKVLPGFELDLCILK
jgi:Uma2 family endonuclease